ncbi:MAG: aminopeptidase, partial [Clostridiales bacterium]
NGDINKQWLKNASAQQIELEASWQISRMQAMDAYIGLRAKDNIYEMAGLAEEKLAMYNKLLLEPVHHDIRVAHTKWVILRYPNDSMAQEAKMATDDFREFYFNVCNLDYAKMSQAMTPLQDLLNKSQEIQVIAPGTDLRFKIAGIGAVKCDGHRNIPDGEVYTAPVKDSVEGYISYNTPSSHQGKTYENIRLEFQKGKIIKAEAGPYTDAINKIFDMDEGSRYIGEFAFGLNPHILRPVNDILFDEKITGSIHFTPGSCYTDAYNGNKSGLHWDLVTILREDFGGGEIYCDGNLIQKNGIFVLPELDGLNRENLL